MRVAFRVAALFLVLPGVAAAGIEVETRNLIGTTRYRTFAFEEGTPARRAVAQERILSGIERELRASGVVLVSGPAQLHVVTHVLVDRHKLEDLDSPDFLEYWTAIDSVDAFDLRAGTLVVDLVDTVQQRRVWRGVASAPVKGSVDQTLKLLDKLLRRLFREFPGK